MTGSKILVAVAIMALFYLTPSTASAQGVIPHAFFGSATVNGSPATDGASVAAFVDGRQIASVAVSGGSYPALNVAPSDGESFEGKTVSFTIGGLPAAETAIWVQGEVTILDLNGAPAQATPIPTPPTPTPIILAGERGATGSSGLAGPPGQQGIQGPAGPSGSGGPAGAAGVAGPGGVAGPSGSQGLTGAAGDAGDSGSPLFGILALVFAILAFLGTFGGMLWRSLVE